MSLSLRVLTVDRPATNGLHRARVPNGVRNRHLAGFDGLLLFYSKLLKVVAARAWVHRVVCIRCK